MDPQQIDPSEDPGPGWLPDILKDKSYVSLALLNLVRSLFSISLYTIIYIRICIRPNQTMPWLIN